MSTSFIYDHHFLDHETGTHPETPGRLEAIHGALEADRSLWSRLQHVKPAPASDEDITRCHSAELIDQIREASERGAGMLDADTIISRQSFDVARLAAGAATIVIETKYLILLFDGEYSSTHFGRTPTPGARSPRRRPRSPSPTPADTAERSRGSRPAQPPSLRGKP